jgi:putative ABC transport system ATP-binding protein
MFNQLAVSALLPELAHEDRLFTVRQLAKTYSLGEVQVQALRSIDLDVAVGELLVLLGTSGSGKSTLLNLLGGLDVPTSGTIHFCDFDLTAADERARTLYRRQQIGFVFQFYNLIPSLTARENVELVTQIAERPMLPEEALELVGLGERLNSFPAQLSGGEQQRVAIARAIAKQPAVLLCDEPTGALDFATGKLVLEALAEVNRRLHTTTVLITHNAVIGAIAQRVIRLSSGQISEVLVNERQASAGELSW